MQSRLPRCWAPLGQLRDRSPHRTPVRRWIQKAIHKCTNAQCSGFCANCKGWSGRRPSNGPSQQLEPRVRANPTLARRGCPARIPPALQRSCKWARRMGGSWRQRAAAELEVTAGSPDEGWPPRAASEHGFPRLPPEKEHHVTEGVRFWGAVEAPGLTWKSLPRTVPGASAFGEYGSACLQGVEKPHFSWILMGSEFTGTWRGRARSILAGALKNICTKQKGH